MKKKLYDEIVNKTFIKSNREKKIKLRWNDSGDFFSKVYIDIAKNINKKSKENKYNVDSYAYTKVADAVVNLDNPDDILFSFSSDANKKQQSKSKTTKTKHQELIAKDLTDKAKIFKKDIRNKYILDPDTKKNIFESPDKK